MFKALIYTRPTGNGIFEFNLVDSCFIEAFCVPTTYTWHSRSVIELIKTYKKRKRHVAANLVLYYKWMEGDGLDIKDIILNEHRITIDEIDRGIGYTKMYLPLLRKSYLRDTFKPRERLFKNV